MMSMRRYGQSLNYVRSSVNRQHLAPRATRCPIRHASETLSLSDAECLPVAAEAIIAACSADARPIALGGFAKFLLAWWTAQRVPATCRGYI